MIKSDRGDIDLPAKSNGERLKFWMPDKNIDDKYNTPSLWWGLVTRLEYD